MKKLIMLLLGMLMLASSHGQDTITEADTCYMFWPHSNTLWNSDTNYRVHYAYNCFFENVATPGTLIYGISLRGDFFLDSCVSVRLAVKDKDASRYRYCDTGWVDSSVVYRYLKFRVINNNNVEIDYGEKCNEIYFHRPWPVPDTFYVVVSYGTNFNGDGSLYIYYARNETIRPQGWYQISGDGEPPYYYPLPGMAYDATPWGLEFPILEPNRKRCRKPSGLHLVERGNGWATLGWNGGSGDRYRVTVEGPDDTVVVTTADTTIRLDSLLPDANYLVGVQSMCRYQHYDYDSTLLNPGVAQMYFYNPGVGVDGIDGIPRVAVYPNPAKDRIVLESEDGTQVRGTLMDLAGREIITVDFRSSIALDVSPLASGPYLLRLTTPSATIVRKLLIQ